MAALPTSKEPEETLDLNPEAELELQQLKMTLQNNLQSSRMQHWAFEPVPLPGSLPLQSDDERYFEGFQFTSERSVKFAMFRVWEDLTQKPSFTPTATLAQLYTPIEEDTFRLLDLSADASRRRFPSCELRHAALGTAAGNYVAISHTWLQSEYSWDDKALPATAHLRIGKEIVRVQGWVAYILILLHQSGIETVWIDVLCINQADNVERGHQVARMGEIYRSASEVAIILGMSTGATDVALRKLADPMGLPYRLGKWQILEHLYWNRAWILQEIAVAKMYRIICGRTTVSWPAASAVLHQLSQFDSSNMSIKAINEYASGKRPDILEVLVQTWGAQCVDSRDAIFAKIPLARNGPEIVGHPDYTVPAEVIFTRFARTYIGKTQSLDILLYARHDNPMLPSWVPDWTPMAQPNREYVQHNTQPGAQQQWNEVFSSKESSELLVRGHIICLYSEDLSPQVFSSTQQYPSGYAEGGPEVGNHYLCYLYSCSWNIVLRKMTDHWVLMPFHAYRHHQPFVDWSWLIDGPAEERDPLLVETLFNIR